MKCTHEKTYKLFYMSCNPRKWIRTIYSICQKCGTVVVKANKEVETK